MRIGLVDVDAESRGKVTYPNLALMKISAYHKRHGDTVEWYSPLLSGHMDVVYLARVFGDEYTRDYNWPVDADRVITGGSGYAITVEGGREVYHPERDPPLPPEIEAASPDYSIYEQYGLTDTAYGFLTRGCPRACFFCHVCAMQGRKVRTVARLRDFWDGQKHISLLDPNLTCSRDWPMHIRDLADSRALVDFTQGLDIRAMTPDKCDDLNAVRWERIHFAWDRPEEDNTERFRVVMDRLKRARKETVSAYVLTNAGSTHEQDLWRVETLRSLGITPYVMIYRKQTAPPITRKLQRYTNSPMIFWQLNNFDEYQRNEGDIT